MTSQIICTTNQSNVDYLKERLTLETATKNCTEKVNAFYSGCHFATLCGKFRIWILHKFVFCLQHAWLRKIPKWHLTSCCGNFVEKESFCRVLGDWSETLWKMCPSTKFPLQEICWNFGILRGMWGLPWWVSARDKAEMTFLSQQFLRQFTFFYLGYFIFFSRSWNLHKYCIKYALYNIEYRELKFTSQIMWQQNGEVFLFYLSYLTFTDPINCSSFVTILSSVGDL